MIPPPRKDVADLHVWETADRVANAAFIPLHLNENPYPPPPEVMEAIQQASSRVVRTFPDPDCSELVAALAEVHKLHANQLLVGPGSTELQRCVMTAFVEPGDKIGYLWPSSAFFRYLAKLHGGVQVPLEHQECSQEEAIFYAPEDLKVLFLCSPNTPSGIGIDTEVISNFARAHPRTLVVVDEAYEAYRGENVLDLAHKFYPNVLISRTFSKAYALAGLRVGYVIGHQGVVSSLRKVAAPYGVSSVAQAAATAALRCTEWLAETIGRVRATREHVRMELMMRGFETSPSEANFFYMRGTDPFRLEKTLRDRNIVVRRYEEFEMRDGVRVSVGTEEQMDLFISTLDYVRDMLPMRNSSSSTNIRKINFNDLPVDPAPAPAPPADLDPDLEL